MFPSCFSDLFFTQWSHFTLASDWQLSHSLDYSQVNVHALANRCELWLAFSNHVSLRRLQIQLNQYQTEANTGSAVSAVSITFGGLVSSGFWGFSHDSNKDPELGSNIRKWWPWDLKICIHWIHTGIFKACKPVYNKVTIKHNSLRWLNTAFDT